jgi:hypothetical protein
MWTKTASRSGGTLDVRLREIVARVKKRSACRFGKSVSVRIATIAEASTTIKDRH